VELDIGLKGEGTGRKEDPCSLAVGGHNSGS
jgi:hypothetical protein